MIDEGGNVFKTFTDYVDESPVNFIQFRIEPDHDWCGKRVMDITLPPGSLLVSLSRGEEEMLPKGGTVLQAGDVLVLCALEEGDTPNLSLVETVLEKEDFTPGMTLGRSAAASAFAHRAHPARPSLHHPRRRYAPAGRG